jgi:hypothetical protein
VIEIYTFPVGLSSLSGNSPFKRAGAYASLRESALPSNIQRREQSRISLILEENTEEEDFSALVAAAKMAASAATTAAAAKGDDVVDNREQGPISPGSLPTTGFLLPTTVQNHVNNNNNNNNNSSNAAGTLYSNTNNIDNIMNNNGGNTNGNNGLSCVNNEGTSMLWSVNNSSNSSSSNSGPYVNNNNNNGPDWRLPQLPPIFEAKSERPLQVREFLGTFFIQVADFFKVWNTAIFSAFLGLESPFLKKNTVLCKKILIFV